MKKNRVLVVDDVRVIRFALRNYLEHAGYVVAEAEDCRTAREVILREPPDAVVLDHDLPDGLSYDLIGDLLESNPKVAIVVLTAHGTQKVHDEVLRLGAKRLLLKPVDLSVVRDAIESLIR